MKSSFYMLAAALFLATSAVSAADLPVGASSDPTNWLFSGVHTFAPAAVVEQLQNDFELQAIAHPSAPLFEFLTTLQQRLEQGYRYCGFVDAAVQVEPNLTNGRVTIRVDEGVRFQAGKVVVEGVSAEIAEDIVHRLTEKHIADPDAMPSLNDQGEVLRWVDWEGDDVSPVAGVWKSDEPVHWDSNRQQRFRKEAEQTLSDHGYPQATVTLQLRPQGETANLAVKIDDLGPPAAVHDIHLIGSTTHSSDDVARFLNLESGAVVTRALRHEIRQKLYESGRFASIRFETERRLSGLTLRIHVQDTPLAPRLDEPLSDEAQSLLRMRQWLLNELRAGTELVAEWPTHPRHPQLIISTNGITITYSDQSEIVQVIDISAEGSRLIDTVRQKSLVIAPQYARINLGLCLKANTDGDAERIATCWSIGYTRSDDTSKEELLPLRFDTCFDPSCFVALAGEPNRRVDASEQNLRIFGDSKTLIVNDVTGEWVKCERTNDDGVVEFRAYPARGRRAAVIAQLGPSYAAAVCRGTSDCPVTGLADFVLNSIFDNLLAGDLLKNSGVDDQFVERWIGVGRTFVGCGALRPLDLWVTARPEATAGKDAIGDAYRFRLAPSKALPIDEDLIKSALPLASYLYDRQSWPWTLSRQAAFLHAGRGDYSIRIVSDTLEYESCGPLAHWLAAELLARQHPRMAGQIAVRGKSHLDIDRFRGDFRLLLPRDRSLYLAVLRQFSHLSANELDAVKRAFPQEGELVAELAKIGAVEQEDEAAAVLMDVVARHWESTWRQRLADRLDALSKLDVPRANDQLFDDELWKSDKGTKSTEEAEGTGPLRVEVVE
jgi:hypothetical protein